MVIFHVLAVLASGKHLKLVAPQRLTSSSWDQRPTSSVRSPGVRKNRPIHWFIGDRNHVALFGCFLATFGRCFLVGGFSPPLFSFPAAVPCWHLVSVHCDFGVHLAVQFLNPVVIGLDNVVVHELLHCVHLEFLGELGGNVWMLQPQGKIVHCPANDLVHEGRINFGLCRLEGPVFLFPYQRLVCSRMMVTSARIAQLKKPWPDCRQSHQEERCRFAPCRATDALIEWYQADTHEPLHQPDSLQAPNTGETAIGFPSGKLRMFDKSTVAQDGHQEEHLQDEAQETVSNVDLFPLLPGEPREALQFCGWTNRSRAQTIILPCGSVSLARWAAPNGDKLPRLGTFLPPLERLVGGKVGVLTLHA